MRSENASGKSTKKSAKKRPTGSKSAATKQTRRSRYDELHDKYHRILTTKAGTRYERLAALVFKALEEKNVVIHDLKLCGEDADVQHQIDVTVEVGGKRIRKLIECKDFDLSKDKVGLDVVRNFRSVVEDTKADEAVIITCTSFTEDAQKYAASKNIKLAVLRVFEETDMNGRVKTVILNITSVMPKNPRAAPILDPVYAPLFEEQLMAIGISGEISLYDPIHVVKGDERLHFNEFFSWRMNDAIKEDSPNVLDITVPADGWQFQVGNNPPISFLGVKIDFEVDRETITREMTSQRVAELVLSGFGDSDIIIFGDQIERRSIDQQTGKVL